MSRLVIGPFNRVEGDLEVTLEAADGRVASAQVTAPLFRGFEQILVGRAPLDALVIAPRICGICSISQSVAAARALGQALGVRPPPNGRRVADLLLAVENAADHLTHFALFFMPDFARSEYAGRPWHAEAARRFAATSGQSARAAMAARARLLHVVGLLAGKWPHSLTLQPGGVAKSVDLGERVRLGLIVGEFRRYLEQSLFGGSLESLTALDSFVALEHWGERHGDSDLALFLRLSRDLSLDSQGRGVGRFLSYGGLTGRAGLWCDGRVAPLDLDGLREDVSHGWMQGGALHPARGQTRPDADKPMAYSWSKAPRLDGLSCEVGALARQAVNGHPLIADVLACGGWQGSVHDRVVARLLELAQLVIAMEGLIAALNGDGPYCLEHGAADRAEGAGLAEAARGALGHWLRIENGVIAGYQIVAPTTWNFSPRDADGNPGPLEQALEGTLLEPGVNPPLMVQHIVRSFDPCMSCTVH
ncbi:periplasmic [NiFeSe] hydrogenase large subunit [mine drainage metagenome]|uniref:Periplasmic [NiFeSe] hydrogenase large subunit n=1 Tax=mine drainage metagenome TaxID=410659 RepID=A0A1J5QXG3_9ZZZZ